MALLYAAVGLLLVIRTGLIGGVVVAAVAFVAAWPPWWHFFRRWGAELKARAARMGFVAGALSGGAAPLVLVTVGFLLTSWRPEFWHDLRELRSRGGLGFVALVAGPIYLSCMGAALCAGLGACVGYVLGKAPPVVPPPGDGSA